MIYYDIDVVDFATDHVCSVIYLWFSYLLPSLPTYLSTYFEGKNSFDLFYSFWKSIW